MTSKTFKKTLVLCLLASCIVLSGCQNASNEDQFHKEINIDITHNLDFTLFEKPPIIIYTGVDLYVVNKTSDCIVFPYNYGVRIFVLQNDNWIEIPDVLQHAFDHNVTLDANNGPFPDAVVSVNPDYSKLGNISGQLRMRIVVVGRQCVNGVPVDQEFADFIEVPVQP